MKYLHLTAAAAVLASSTYAIGFTASVSMDNMSLEKSADTLKTDLFSTVFTAATPLDAGTAANNVAVAAGNVAAPDTLQGTATTLAQNSNSGNYLHGGQDLVGTKTKVSKFVTGFGVLVHQDLGGATFGATVKINSGKIQEHTQSISYDQPLQTMSTKFTQGVIGANNDTVTTTLPVMNVRGLFEDIATTFAPKYTLGLGASMKVGGFTVGAGVDFMRVETTVAGKVRETNNNAASAANAGVSEFSDAKQTKNVNLIKIEMGNAISDKLSMSFNYKFGKLKSQTFAWKTAPGAGTMALTAHAKGYETKDRDIQSYGVGVNFRVM